MSNYMHFPEGYKPAFQLIESERAVKLIKDTYEYKFAEALDLIRVSAPLIVESNIGINDDLNGYERKVEFDIKDTGKNVEIVQSLAKWKRIALKKYGFEVGKGLYTDMSAIRRDEKLDNIHSVYVDQWDWEKIITKEQRNMDYLRDVVIKLLKSLQDTEEVLIKAFPEKNLKPKVPSNIHFITSQELEDLYPDKTPKERENLITKKYKAVFLSQIGKKLKSGNKHDGRSPDYDDWELNGDILLWYEPLQIALEISSMGIRVNPESLEHQLKEAGKEYRKTLLYHTMLLNNELPLTIGGGLGQSRICMYLLGTVHIGEVQASIWPQKMVDYFREKGVEFL